MEFAWVPLVTALGVIDIASLFVTNDDIIKDNTMAADVAGT